MSDQPRKKISEMVSLFAGDFIRLGEDVHKRNVHLKLACTAWNLANLPKNMRKKALRKYLDDFRKLNPEANHAAVEHDLKELIAEKLIQFPLEKATIVTAEYKEEDDEDHISVAAVPAGTAPPAEGMFRWN
jgi:hypothetical protein